MRFLPNKRKVTTGDVPPAYNFTQGGFSTSIAAVSYALNRCCTVRLSVSCASVSSRTQAWLRTRLNAKESAALRDDQG
jgi:hypothetical protein